MVKQETLIRMRREAVAYSDQHVESVFARVCELVAGGFGAEANLVLRDLCRKSFLAGADAAATELELQMSSMIS
jgi:hypothetical protein